MKKVSKTSISCVLLFLLVVCSLLSVNSSFVFAEEAIQNVQRKNYKKFNQIPNFLGLKKYKKASSVIDDLTSDKSINKYEEALLSYYKSSVLCSTHT